jgi:hypothetical protein
MLTKIEGGRADQITHIFNDQQVDGITSGLVLEL